MEIIIRVNSEIEIPEKVKVGNKWFYSDEYTEDLIEEKCKRWQQEHKIWKDYKEFFVFAHRNKDIRGEITPYKEIGEERRLKFEC